MSVNINSVSDSYNAWYDAKFCGNTRGTTPKELAQIEKRWEANLNSWKAQAANDENQYEISDEDFSASKSKRKQKGKDKTGCSGKKTGMIARGVVDGAAGAAGIIATKFAKESVGNLGEKAIGLLGEKAAQKVGQQATERIAKDAAEKAAKKALKKSGEKLSKDAIEKMSKNAAEKAVGKSTEAVAEKGAQEIADEAAKEASEKASTKASKSKAWIITAPLSMATGAAYQADKPNEDEHKAAQTLYEELLPEAGNDLCEAQSTMDDATDYVAELTEEANAANEDTNEEIKENKAEFDVFRQSAEDLQKRAKNGEKLTDSEKESLAEMAPVLQELGDNIEEVADENSDYVNELHDEIGDYQSDFDDAANTIAEVEGLTDYAEGFDSTAETMCYVESVSQGLNAASGAVAAVDAGKFAASGGWFTAWAWAFSAMGAAGAVSSGLGMKEQYNWAREIGQEIDMREATQDFGAATLESYDEQIEMYDDNMSIVEDLEMEIPDDLEVPEELAETKEFPQEEESANLNEDKDKDKNKTA